MGAAEKKMDDHDWLPKEPEEIKRDYAVPHFGMDRDISGGLENIKVAQELVGKSWKWNPEEYKNPAKATAVSGYYQ